MEGTKGWEGMKHQLGLSQDFLRESYKDRTNVWESYSLLRDHSNYGF